jgi:hypothetical protein
MKKLLLLISILVLCASTFAQAPLYGDRLFISNDKQDTLRLTYINHVPVWIMNHKVITFKGGIRVDSLYLGGTWYKTISGGGGGSMTWPSTSGIPNYNGTTWGTSYTVGTSANNLVQLNSSGKLPAVDGSLLTGLSSGTTYTANSPIIITGSVISADTSYRKGKLATFYQHQKDSTLAASKLSPTGNGSGLTGITAGQVGAQVALNFNLIDATSSNQTYTLPTAIGITGQIYVIKKIDNSVHTVTIATTSSQTVDGYNSIEFSNQYQTYQVVSNGTNWFIISIL